MSSAKLAAQFSAEELSRHLLSWQRHYLYTVLPVFILFYLAMPLLHWLSLTAENSVVMSLVALSSCALGVLLWKLSPRNEYPVRIAISLIMTVVLANSLLHIWLTMQPMQSTNLLIVLVSNAMLLCYRRDFWRLLVATWLGWLIIVNYGWLNNLAPTDQWIHFTYMLLICSVASALGFNMRMRMQLRQELTRLRLDESINKQEQEIERRKQIEQQLQSQNDMLDWLANHDSLTGLANRRRFNQQLAQALQVDTSLALLVIDIDFFKDYNDSQGHPAGDKALSRFSELLKRSAEATGGVAARLGGEEFILLLPKHDKVAAIGVHQTLREQLRKAEIKHPASQVSRFLTFSAGMVVCARNQSCSASKLLSSADEALYIAKKRGRDQMVCWHAQKVGTRQF